MSTKNRKSFRFSLPAICLLVFLVVCLWACRQTAPASAYLPVATLTKTPSRTPPARTVTPTHSKGAFYSGMLTSGGEYRSYLLYVPSGYKVDGEPLPLVISLHGFASNPSQQASMTQWHKLAESENFLVVFPAGTGFPRRWRADGSLDSDVVFIADLIDRLQGRYQIDPRRIYADGFSNGGGMVFMLACRLSYRVAAVGTVAGAYVLPLEACQPERALPMMVFHGTGDPIVPFTGGPVHDFEQPLPVISDWVQALAKKQGCDPEGQRLSAPGSVRGFQYDDCDDDASIFYYIIPNGGHTWPGSSALPRWLVGPSSRDLNATDLLWAFYQEYRLPEESD
jgi:polyhydroxybutyrate depolymerase